MGKVWRRAWITIVLAALGPGPSLAAGVPADLVAAARNGDGNAVHRLLAAEADVAATDATGYTALHWAAVRAHWRIVSELLDAGALVNAVGADGGTPLHWACHHDNAAIVGRMLDSGADLAVQNRWGRTPLHVAARRGCAAVARLLIDRGADLGATTLEGWTPLHVAERSGQPEMVALLLAAGADPGRRDEDGHRPGDLHTVRPTAIAIDPAQLEDAVGLYDLGGGFQVKVWQQGGGLRIREFAPDELIPVGPDGFICRQEPWRVRFERGDDGAVAAVSIDFLRRTVSGERTLSPRYVGSAVCISCHAGAESGHADAIWMRSRHGHAYWRLAADWALRLGRMRPQYHDLESPRQDERCLLCHVTGAQDPDALLAPSFRSGEGVGCEACHGAGSEYVDPEVMADRETFLAHGGRIPDADTCRSCHRRAEDFDFAAAWPKIAHPRPS